ncbi:MAG: hypothetical protein HYV97_02735 [Bdellovibrio sp.]|nr:hypothetical protein [Bdellovibrio sp.]
MEFFLEALFAALIEVIVPILARIICEIVSYMLPTDSKAFDRVISFVFIFGILGVISGFVVPPFLIKWPTLAITNLILLPIFVGYVFKKVGDTKLKREKHALKVDTFYGGYFATLIYLLARLLVLNKHLDGLFY